jgi:sarcosine oxidase subunit alpha
MPQPLAIADIAAGTQLGTIPAQSAGIVAQERVALIPIATGPRTTATAPDTSHYLVPGYLAGRFGTGSITCAIAPLEKRRLEVGALVYADADEKSPFKAIGVVVRVGDGGAAALLTASAQSASTAYVREDTRSIAVRVIGPYASSTNLDAPLGSGPGAS